MSRALGPAPPTTDVIIVLASKSPNRLQLLRQIGIEPKVIASNFEENLSKDLPVSTFVEETSVGKLKAVKEKMNEEMEPYHAIIACDTVIYFDDEIIGKPRNADDASSTLKRLRGKRHSVFTGVAIGFGDGSINVFSEESSVEFGDIPDRIIDEYVASGEPLNKAGSYGIQNSGAKFVKRISGCFSNIVGLPIYRVHTALVERNII